MFVAHCARQFGKSYEWCLTSLETAIKKKGARIKYGAPTSVDLNDFIIPKFKEIIPKLPEGVRPKFNKSENN
jgi:hypothetical protein